MISVPRRAGSNRCQPPGQHRPASPPDRALEMGKLGSVDGILKLNHFNGPLATLHPAHPTLFGRRTRRAGSEARLLPKKARKSMVIPGAMPEP